MLFLPDRTFVLYSNVTFCVYLNIRVRIRPSAQAKRQIAVV